MAEGGGRRGGAVGALREDKVEDVEGGGRGRAVEDEEDAEDADGGVDNGGRTLSVEVVAMGGGRGSRGPVPVGTEEEADED